MKLLIVSPKAISGVGENTSELPTAGWIGTILRNLLDQSDAAVIVAYPDEKQASGANTRRLSYFTYPSAKKPEMLRPAFEENLERFSPDAILTFGTESRLKNNVIRCLADLGYGDRTAIWLQGISAAVYHCYNGGLSDHDIRKTLKEHILHNGPLVKKQQLKQAAGMERDSLMLCRNVIGRTAWDHAWVRGIHPECRYFHCNETMRDAFYRNTWEYDRCIRHSVFVSQCNDPFKGFHHVVMALKQLLDEFPDARLYTTGRDILHMRGRQKLRYTSYEKYLVRLIRKLDLEDHVYFVGVLDEEQMCRQYLSANVSVLASSVENSPNSLSEAMLLGVPSVASDVGGVSTLFRHGTDGYLYPFGDVPMLAEYIRELFLDQSTAAEFAENERNRAMQLFDAGNNCKTLLKICESLSGQGGKMEEQ